MESTPLLQAFARPHIGDSDREKTCRASYKDEVLHRDQLLAVRFMPSLRIPKGNIAGGFGGLWVGMCFMVRTFA
jgi:hypothetical protein